MPAIFKKTQNIKLRWKLIIVFFILATIAGFTSGVSLLFIDRIQVKMDSICKTAFPLTSITRKLIGDMADAHILILELLNAGDPEMVRQQAERFDEKEKALTSQLSQLNEMSGSLNLQLDIASLQTSQQAFFQQAHQVVTAHLDILEKEATKNRKLAEFDLLGEETGKLLKTFSNVSEASINEKEEVAKTMEQSGEATVEELAGFISGMFTDDFPLLKGASLLEGYFVELMNVNGQYFNEQDPEKLEALAKSFQSVLKKANSRIKRTKRHLKTDKQKETLRKVADSFTFIESSVLGDDGMFAGHRSYLEADERIKTLLTRLSEAIAGYRTSLAGISSSSEQINTQAQTSMSAMVQLARKSMIIIIGACIIIAVLFGILISGSITKPIERIVAITKAIGQGDLSQRLQMDRGDEVGQLAMAIDAMVERLKLNNTELQKNMTTMEDILAQGTMVAEVVSSGSSQILDTSHSVSQGASEQAASLEEVTSAMGLVASQIKSSADNASQADLMARSVSEAAAKGNDRMKSMMSAMEGITQSSNEIAKIIKAIDDIAFQTNLLALNAAVEAARAGKYGKGFAVVAQEVRSLAGRSAKAARETAELIENSVSKTKGGAEIVDETAQSLQEIVNGVVKVSDLVSEIAKASSQQNQGIKDINEGLTLIEQVTQQNSATAEESASASVELSAQAQKLKDILSRHNQINQEIPAEKPLALPKTSAPRRMKTEAPVPGKSDGAWGIKYENPKSQGVAGLDDGSFKDF